MKKFKTIITAFLVAVLMVPIGLMFSGCGEDNSVTRVDNYDDLKTAVEAGGTIVTTKSIELEDTITVSKEVVIRVSGTIDAPAVTATDKANANKPAFIVQSTGKLTIENGSVEASNGDQACAIEVNGGALVIGSGVRRIKGVASAIKARTGTVKISAGTISCKLVQNKSESLLVGTGYTIGGGKFVGFDPTSFLDESLRLKVNVTETFDVKTYNVTKK